MITWFGEVHPGASRLERDEAKYNRMTGLRELYNQVIYHAYDTLDAALMLGAKVWLGRLIDANKYA